MRLIDADKLMEDIIKICKCQPYLEGMQSEIVYIQDVIDEQPTVYDIDKVVGQLEELKEWEDVDGKAYYTMSEKQVINKAIKIVKAGGIDE